MVNRVTKSFLIWAGAAAAAVAGASGVAVWLGQPVANAAEAPNVSVNVAHATADSVAEQQFQAQVRPLLKANCFKCHGDGKHKGDIALDKFTSLASIQQDLETWQSVHDELEQHDMPPEKSPQPSAGDFAKLMTFTTKVLDDPSKPRDPGFVPIHRLNRNEYNNTIRDLVGVDFHPADDFPADDTGYGFDNIADVLSMSPLLAEKYLTAAEQVMDKAIILENPFKSKLARYAGEKMSGGVLAGNAGRELPSEGEISQEHRFVAKGQYEFRIDAAQDEAGTEPAKMRVMVAGKEVQTFEVRNHRGRSKIYTVRTEVPEGTHTIGFDFINDFYDPNAENPKRRDRNLYVASLEVEGPIDLAPPPPSDVQKRLLFCGPADGSTGETCAGQILSSFAGKAYRRPATEGEVAGLLKLYRMGRSQGDSFEASCKFALTAVLVSPQFLYRMESDPAGSPAAHALSDYELASRLSYFLWSSTPDDVLLNLAGQKKLHEPAVLGAQVKRMLADTRSQAFIRNFAGQWLELRNLSQVSPDPKTFPQFDQTLREDMQQEGERYFASIVRDDRSVLDLLDSNYTFLNGRLARFYGIDGVDGDDFRKVALTGDQAKRRGGVLTMGAVLTVSALPNRTSPVKRGKFILDQILGTPPPPPPPGVPALVEKGEVAAATTVRARLEQHRANPACASCHAKLDPLGFALENFDAIGRWRDKDNNVAIDSTGNLPSGEAIDGPAGLRAVLVAHKDQFLKAFVSKLMTYSLGRGTTQADAAMIRQIYKQAEANDCKFSTVMDGIVRSDAFLKRRAKSL